MVEGFLLLVGWLEGMMLGIVLPVNGGERWVFDI